MDIFPHRRTVHEVFHKPWCWQKNRMYLYGYCGYELFVDVAVNNLLGSILLLWILAGGVSAREAVLTFNEIHYHPSAAHDSGEWVELYNQMAVPVDISGWKLSAGIDFDFPEGTVVEPGAYLVVAKEPAKLQAQTGFADALGPYTGSLSNGGETIRLRNNKGSFRTRVDTRLVVPEDQLWSVDFQGDGNGGAFGQLAPPNLMSGLEPVANLGGVWNAFTVAGHANTTTDPSLVLVDSAGTTSTVTFAMDGTVTGFSNPGSALVGDYVFVHAGNSDPDVDWTLSGLLPGTNYAIFAYGSAIRDIRLLFDRNGDGLLTDDSDVVVNATGRWITPITASPGGAIMGRALPGTVSEGNWSGFQLAFAQPEAPGPDPGPGKGSGPRRIMDEVRYNDKLPWSVGPDGSGVTLAKIDPLAKRDADNWAPSADINGTPGAPNTITGEPHMVINEMASVNGAVFRVELFNRGTGTVQLVDWRLLSDGDVTSSHVISNLTIHSGAYAVLDEQTLGFRPGDEDRLYLFDGSPGQLVDAAVVRDEPLGRIPDGGTEWRRMASGTLGAPNLQPVNRDIVINEILYRGVPQETPVFEESDEEWIELYNRGTGTVDLTGWSLDEGLDFDFPVGTQLAPGAFLLVVNDRAGFTNKYPGMSALGDFGGRLDNSHDTIVLRDGLRNTVDSVSYHDRGRWPEVADGAGASLELRDARADNSLPESWAPGRSGTDGAWETITYRDTATDDGFGNDAYHEFLLGLLDAGDVLIDDVVVTEDPDGAAVPLIQNGDFEGDTLGAAPVAWRAMGTHRGATVIVDPDAPGNQCLHLRATGPTGDKHNKLETTFANGQRVEVGSDYEISFRVKWLSGCRWVNSRLYFNYLQRTHLLTPSPYWGTPGRANTSAMANAGPVYTGLMHTPPVPTSAEAVTIALSAADPDGMDTLTLYYSVNEGSFVPVVMVQDGSRWSGVIPAQGNGSHVQFYVEGRDLAGATSLYPAAGPDSRALYAVANPVAGNGRQKMRILLHASDRNFLFDLTQRMSNDRMGATVIYNNQVVYHDVALRLKASAFGRYNNAHYGFNMRFDPMHLFRGIHPSISVERGGSSQVSKILLASHLLSRAGGGNWSTYPDVADVTHPGPGTSATTDLCLLAMARHTDAFFDGQYDGDGTLYNHELLYNPNGTIDGNPESLKRNNPYNHTRGRSDFQDWHGDKEGARWGFQIRSNRARDNYAPVLAMGTTLQNLSGSNLLSAMEQVVDVDQFARSYTMFALYGNDDTYTRIWEHNWRMYARPDDGKLIALPWDLDRCFQLSTPASLVGGNRLASFLNLPTVQRRMHGHVLDITDTTCNLDYISDWGDRYGAATGINFGSLVTYVDTRATYLRSLVPAEIPFEILSGTSRVTNSPVRVEGRAWVNVQALEVNGVKIPIHWLDGGNWSLDIPLELGVNGLQIRSLDHQGAMLDTHNITVTNATPFTQAISVHDGAVHWEAIPGITYFLDESPSLSTPVWSLHTTINAAGPVSVPVEPDPEVRRYYRLRWEAL
jgi:hypothetical protein